VSCAHSWSRSRADSMASDVASQGGGVGPGRDRKRRGLLSDEGRSGSVAELRDRERSPERGRRRAVVAGAEAAAAHGRYGRLI
jgi:hypothetical protein